MTDCALAATGSNTRVLVVLAVLLVGVGVTLLLIVRRRDIGPGATLIVALALAVTALGVVDTSRAGAQVACPSATGVAPVDLAVTPTTPAPTTTAPVVTTTTTSTTTTSTSTTTTTLPVPDLTPTITGPAVFGPGQADFVVTVSNVGPGATTGPMTFSVNVALLTGPPPVTMENPVSPGWTAAGAGTQTLTFTSTALVLDPGDVSTVGFTLVYGNENPATMNLTVALPAGIGGETNSANNTASLPTEVPPPPA